MTHTEILNQILSHSCPAEVLDDNFKVFELEGHCIKATIVAKSINVLDDYSSEYEIRSFELQDF